MIGIKPQRRLKLNIAYQMEHCQQNSRPPPMCYNAPQTYWRKARLNTKVPAGQVRQAVARERESALAVRDPIAIARAGERYKVVAEVLAGVADDEEINLAHIALTVSQAGRALGYSPKEIRRLIRAGNIAAEKRDNQWWVSVKEVL
jgi:hypothetical protein